MLEGIKKAVMTGWITSRQKTVRFCSAACDVKTIYTSGPLLTLMSIRGKLLTKRTTHTMQLEQKCHVLAKLKRQHLHSVAFFFIPTSSTNFLLKPIF